MKKQSVDSYSDICAYSKKTRILEGILQLIGWDQETYMPELAESVRALQIEELSGLIHQRKVSKEFKDLLSKLIDISSGKIKDDSLSEDKRRCLIEWRKEFLIETKLPESFVKKFAHLTSEAQIVWRKAKENNRFEDFAPKLEKIISACKEKAELIGYQEHPYDALIDLYEPGMTTKKLQEIFGELKKELVPLLNTILKSKQQDDSALFGNFAKSKQEAFANTMLDALGYDRKKGRLDLSAHPFSMSTHPYDSRITWRIHKTNLINNLSTILHEAGHSLYEMGLDADRYGEPICEARSLGLHESQSRFWEVFIGQGKPFWKHFFPLLKKSFPKAKFCNLSLDQFVNAVNKVAPSLIRVEADEVTYPLHVILRFELEVKLIEGSLKVKDLPKAWEDRMQQMLGICPKDDATGCLQDIHWSMGAFGYFPTYLLGSLYAAHLFKGFKKANPGWEKLVQSGKLDFIKKWLSDNVYRFGKLYSSEEILLKAAKAPFTPKSFIGYLKDKYNA